MTHAPGDGRLPPIDPGRLAVGPFRDSPEFARFSCGNRKLDEFLTKGEASAFEDAGLGRTFLVFHDRELIAYYTLNNDSLRVEYLPSVGRSARRVDNKVSAFPALKIGRLAVSKDWQNRGVGRWLVALIAAECLALGQRCAVRLLILEAKPESIGFYHSCGFALTNPTRRERGKHNRMLFLDLRPLPVYGLV